MVLAIRFNNEFFRSIRGYFHLLTLILGIIILSVGWHSHFGSKWTSLHKDLKSFLNGTTINTEVVGNNPEMRHELIHLPNLLKEQIFLGVSLASFLISLIFYGIYVLGIKERRHPQQTLWSITYNLLFGVGLVVAGGLLMFSATKIDDFVQIFKIIHFFSTVPELPSNSKIQLYSEKFSAGIISVLNGLIFAMIAAVARHETTVKRKKIVITISKPEIITKVDTSAP